jgi:hypothetical protein
MDIQLESGLSKIRQPLSVPFRLCGWLAFSGAVPLELRFIYEQTVLTWKHGPQMLGWTLVHTYGGLFAIGILAVMIVYGWLLAFVVIWVRLRITQKALFPFGAWAQFVVLVCAAALFYVPYGFWQFVTLKVSGPGQNAVGQLTAAAGQNQRYLVNAFLRSGVAINALGQYDRTALDEACLTGQVEMARYLVSKKAQLDLAPDCRKVAEFAARMKPLVPMVEEQSGRLHIPGTTIEVTAPAPQGDYSRPKSKP